MYTGYVDNMTQSNFATIQPDGSIKPNTEYGTYEKTSDDPLTVTYTFNDKAVWSDGVPIDCDDALLTWAALSGSYPTGQKDDAGADIDIFTPASTNGFSEVKKPTCKPGDKSFTYVYNTPYADWEALLTGSTIMPAHIAAEQGGMSSADNGAALITAIETDNIAAADPGCHLLVDRLELPARSAEHPGHHAAADIRVRTSTTTAPTARSPWSRTTNGGGRRARPRPSSSR